MIDIKPVRDSIFAEIVKPGGIKTSGGIFLQNPIQTKSCKLARVLAIGDGDIFGESDKKLQFNIEIGDIIIINDLSGQSVTVSGYEYVLIPYNGVFGVWKNWQEMDRAE